VDKNFIRIVVRVAIIMVVVTAVTFIAMQMNREPSEPDIQDTPEEAAPKVVIVEPDINKFGVLKDAKALLDEGKRAQAVRKLEETISLNQGSRQAYESLIMLSNIYGEDNNLLKAKELYSSILNDYAQFCDYSAIQQRAAGLNMKILFSSIPTQNSEIYTVVPGDSLIKIAKRYSTTVDLIKSANSLKSDLIYPGMKLKVQRVPFNIVVDKSQSTLTLFQGDEVIKIYMVSTGKNNSTPVGSFAIKDKLIDPVWYTQGAIVPPESPENVLGTRWMGLTTEEPGYGIHGTIEPESIGYQRTEGCVRLINKEVEELFSIVPVGTKVIVID